MRGSSRRRTAIVKGFRMPAVRRRERVHGGRRPKSLEGGNRGGVCAGGGVSLWGFNARLGVRFFVLGRGCRASEWREGDLIGLGAAGRVLSR
jgi:hypothetical protein